MASPLHLRQILLRLRISSLFIFLYTIINYILRMVYTMNTFFNILPRKIIHALDSYNKCTEVEYFQMYYGLQTILYNVIVTSLILICSYLWKCFTQTLLLFIIFGTLRLIAGGFHFNSVIKCISITTLVMLGGGKCLTLFTLNSTLCILLCIITNTLFLFHLPKGTNNNPYSLNYSILQKKRLIYISFFLSVVAFYSQRLRSTIIISMFIVAIFLIPELIHRFQGVE